MNDQPKTLQQHAMYYGTMMGLFWIIKFTLLPMGFRIPLLQLLFIFATCFVPVLGYIYARKYRNKFCDGKISLYKGLIFTVSMYFYASILTAAGHYIYFQFIDNGYLTDTYLNILESLKESMAGVYEESIDQLIENVTKIAQLSPLQLSLQLISQNIFYGILLSIPTALFIMKKGDKNNY